MISRHELLLKYSLDVNFNDLVKDVEKAIIEAAKAGRHHVVYNFDKTISPDRLDTKYAIDELYRLLGCKGYEVSGDYNRMTIGW